MVKCWRKTKLVLIPNLKLKRRDIIKQATASLGSHVFAAITWASRPAVAMAKRPLVPPIGSGYSVKHLDGGYFDPLASCKPLLWLVTKGGLQCKFGLQGYELPLITGPPF